MGEIGEFREVVIQFGTTEDGDVKEELTDKLVDNYPKAGISWWVTTPRPRSSWWTTTPRLRSSLWTTTSR